MKKNIITLILLFVFVVSYGQIKMHPSGQISFQSTNTTGGVQIDPSGKTTFEPVITTSFTKINRTIYYGGLVKIWDIQSSNPQNSPQDSYYVLGNGNVYASSYYNIFAYPTGGGNSPRGNQPIINATDMLSSIGGYYYDNTEFAGFVPDYENNPEVHPEAIDGLMKDLKVERVIGLDATEIEAVLPEAIRHDPQGAICINYQALIPVLIEGFKEQQHTIESLQKQINELKSGYRTTDGTGEQESSKNTLFQNVPNPTNSSTTIDCYLDSSFSKAIITVYDLNGLQLKEYHIYNQGKNTIKIEANEFKPGMYMYSLLIDGKLIDTKRMVITSK